MKFAIFHGNERWILRGLAIDIEKSLLKQGIEVSRHEVDIRNPGKIPEADWFLFVQQGQLDGILGAWKYRKDLVKKSICIFTHFNANNCNFELLNKIKIVSHMSSHQMAISIGNGLTKANSRLMPLGVDLTRHYPLKQDYVSRKLNEKYPEIKCTLKRSYIGFCTRFTRKITYTKRKNYESLFKVVNSLVNLNKNVLIIGDGWQDVDIPNKNSSLTILNPPYKDYNLFYNLMKLFVSVTSYDGGPIPLLESMACGVPSIITNSGFAPDIIEHKKNGYLFQPFEDEQNILKGIEYMDNQNFIRSDLREAAAKYSFDEYAMNLIREVRN